MGHAPFLKRRKRQYSAYVPENGVRPARGKKRLMRAVMEKYEYSDKQPGRQ
jgi:hypothetical protein